MPYLLRRLIKYLISPLLVVGFLFWVYKWQARVQDQTQYYQQTHHQHMTSKLASPASATLSLIGTQPEEPEDTFSLKVRFSSSSPLQNLNYQWRVPDHIAHIQGPLTGRIENLLADTEQELQVQFKLLRVPETAEAPVRWILRADGTEHVRAKYFVLTQEEKNRQQRELMQRRQEYENRQNQGAN